MATETMALTRDELVARAKDLGPSLRERTLEAEQLRRLPDVKTYGSLKLRELADKGPTAAKGIWATAKDAMQDYADLTVDDLIAQFGPAKH